MPEKQKNMERKLMSELLKWKDKSNRKPLLLEGARQVGKTYLLKEFGKRCFKNVAYINFQNPSTELIDLFNGSIEPKRIIVMLELLLNMKISPAYGSEIVPIEVKSGTNVNAKSLKIFREAYSPRVSVRFSLKNTRLDNGLQNISLYSVFLCEQLVKNSSEKCDYINKNS
jgi:AAA+ ATPase superfamily predicted ATPase